MRNFVFEAKLLICSLRCWFLYFLLNHFPDFLHSLCFLVLQVFTGSGKNYRHISRLVCRIFTLFTEKFHLKFHLYLLNLRRPIVKTLRRWNRLFFTCKPSVGRHSFHVDFTVKHLHVLASSSQVETVEGKFCCLFGLLSPSGHHHFYFNFKTLHCAFDVSPLPTWRHSDAV